VIAVVDLRPQYQARIAGRLAELHSTRTLREPISMSRAGVPPEIGDALGRLVRLCMSFNRARQLLEIVLPAALREPGRLFSRRVEQRNGTPKGAIDWPKTTAIRRGREESAEFEFICRTSQRNLLAPENVLLVLLLEDVILANGSRLNDLEVRGLVWRGGWDFFGRASREAQGLIGSPAFRDCRRLVREVQLRGERAVADLEKAVRQRVAARPSEAPEWARMLLSIRADLRWLPRGPADPSIPVEALWLMLAHLEMLVALRSVHPIRQCSDRPERFRSADRQLIPDGSASEWVFLESGRVKGAISIVASGSKESVRYSAFDRLLQYRYEGQPVDRWVVLHGGAEPIESINRNGLDIRFVEMPWPSSPYANLRHVFAGWNGSDLTAARTTPATEPGASPS
jgi:hypothetical protein